MKKHLYKSIIIIVLLTIVYFPLQAQAIVHDPMAYLTAIDNLYAQYDNVMNTWTSIQNQIMQIQQAIDSAKNIDWSQFAVEWDGDFDIRDDIFRAGSSVNRLMNKTRDITSAITKPSIMLGDEKVSIQDLLSYHGDKNLGYALGKTKSSLENTLSSLEDTLTKNLTPEQREYISRKYGISAENYVVLQKATEWVHESLGVAMGKVEDEVRQAELISLDERVDLIIKAVMSTRDANGNVTEGAGMEGIVQLLDIMLEQWAEVGTAVDESVALTARAKLLEMQKEEMVAEERANQIEKVEEFSSQQPFYFYRED